MTTVLYRGPFQGRRVRFLVDSLASARPSMDFVWLDPAPGAEHALPGLERLRNERESVRSTRLLDGSWRALPAAIRELRGFVPAGEDVLAIGFTSLAYARALRPRHLLWAVNGIPEERLLYDASPRSRAIITSMWASARLGRRPDLTIVVSNPMGRLVERRLPGARWAKAPTSVDRDVFTPAGHSPRSTMVYVGSGAPWQGIDVLAPIWSELHRRDPSVRFRVVSRDERARALLRDIPASHAEMIPAHTPTAVAATLTDAELAFLVRLPDVVNEASFPTKFGEYVASGVPVVTTDVGWDISDIVRRTGCGLLVDPHASPAANVDSIMHYRARAGSDPAATLAACTAAADEVSRDHWLALLSAEIVTVLGTPPIPAGSAG